MVYYISQANYYRKLEVDLYSGGHMFTSSYYSLNAFTARIRPGDTVVFGRHQLVSQTRDGDVAAPMQWTVLEKQGSRLLLLNRYQVDLTLVGKDDEPFRYSDSYIRKDLREHLHEWFYGWELELIEDTYLGETKNPAFGTSDDPGVRDKLFLLTAEEVLKYFDPEAYLRGSLTEEDLVPNGYDLLYYPMRDASADAPVVFVDTPLFENKDKNKDREQGKTALELEICEFLGWWTRTPGSEDGWVALYESGGKLNLDGLDATADEVGIRPALWLDLERLKPLLSQD